MVTTIGSLANVPNPGAPISSPWAQDVTRLGVHRFASKAALDAATWPGLVDGSWACTVDNNRLWYFNGSEWLYVAGGLDPTALRASRITAGQVMVIGTPTTILWNSEAWDNNNLHSGATGKYTAPMQGLYTAHARVSIVAAATGERFVIALYKNGATEWARGDDMQSGGTELGLAVTDDVQLDTGDTLEVKVNQVNGVARTMAVGTNVSHFTVRRVAHS